MIAAKIRELKERYERIKYPLQTPGMTEIENQIKVLEEVDRKIKEAALKDEEWQQGLIVK